MAKTLREINDEEILARIKTSTRMKLRMAWVMTGGIALVAAVTATAHFTGHAALATSMWGQTITAAVVGALFAYAFVMMGKYRVSPMDAAASPRLMRRRIDAYQRRWRWLILLNVFSWFTFVPFMPRIFPFFGGAHQLMPLLIGACFAGLIIMMAFILLVLPGWQDMAQSELLNDEFASALRARTMRFGYILTMLLLGGVFLVTLWQPDLTLTALAWALYAGFALPALYYVIADWRASFGDDGHDE